MPLSNCSREKGLAGETTAIRAPGLIAVGLITEKCPMRNVGRLLHNQVLGEAFRENATFRRRSAGERRFPAPPGVRRRDRARPAPPGTAPWPCGCERAHLQRACAEYAHPPRRGSTLREQKPAPRGRE